MLPRVVVHIDLYHDYALCAKIYTGLEILARRQEIQLRFIAAARSSPCAVFIDVADDKGERSLAVDLSDHSNYFSLDDLAACDIYLKRSFYTPDLAAVPPQWRHKIASFGLNFTAGFGYAARRLLATYTHAVARELKRDSNSIWHRRTELARYLKSYLLVPDYLDFEQLPTVPVDAKIIFQTRVWEPESTSENLEEINEERVALVRRLRREFGDRFVGGLVPTPFARKHYPDVAVAANYRQRDFLKLTQRHLIAIYSRGLHHSLAFKMAEYLAASMCIVSDPLRNELPQPLHAGENYLEYRTQDECIAQCGTLLSDPALAAQMRRRNHDYYRRWVEPAQHMLNCLNAGREEM